MAETTAEVRRDIELTRKRMSSTLQELEDRVNLRQLVRDHPWPALAIAFGAGLLLAATAVDAKAAHATRRVTRKARRRMTPMLDGLMADLVAGVTAAVGTRVDSLVGDIRHAVTGTHAHHRADHPVRPAFDAPAPGQPAMRGD